MNSKSLPSTTTFTPVPDPLLGDVLTSIDSLAELKCILRALWHIHRKKGAMRCVSLAELSDDPVLEGALDLREIERYMGSMAAQAIFARAKVRTEDGQVEVVHVLNQPSQRLALQRFIRGKALLPEYEYGDEVSRDKTKRSNIFALYEQEIGLITPLVADELKAAEGEYPQEWIETAVREAVLSGKKSWRYVRAILQRWNREGKSDGKFGRNTKARDPRRYIEEYERRRGVPFGG